MAFDFTLDHRFKHATGTVTFDPAGVNLPVPYAERQAVLREDSPGVWVATAEECVWYLPGAEFAAEPVPGKVIRQTDATQWTIKSVGYLPLCDRYECFCVKERT